MEIVGKQWQKGNAAEVYTAVNIENGFVKFSNGAQCKLETFIQDFKEVKTFINESIKPKTVLNQNNEIDPDAFFNFAGDDNDPLMKTLEQLKQNPNMELKPTVQILPSIDRTDNKIISNPVNVNIPLNPLESRLPQGYVHQENLTNNMQQSSIVQSIQNRLPEWDMFDRSKKTINVKFQLPIEMMLPKASTLETLNEMFETTCTTYLAKQYVDKLLQNPQELIDTLTENIEDWLSVQLTGKAKKKKVIKVSKKKEVIQKENVVNQVTTNVDTDFGRNFKIDVSIPLTVNNEDDVLKVKAKLKELNEQPLTVEIEQQINGLQDMLYIYKLNNPDT